MPNIPEVPKRELLAMEKETTGLYLSGHPMDEYRSLTQKAQAASVKQIIDDLTGESSRPVYKDGMTVRLACVITAVRLKSTRNGSMMRMSPRRTTRRRLNLSCSRVRCSSAAHISPRQRSLAYR